MKYTIHITQEHIDNGIKEDCRKCPAARAILEQIPGAVSVLVNGDGIDLRIDPTGANGPYTHESATPGELIIFMDTFDQGDPAEPMSFEIDLEER